MHTFTIYKAPGNQADEDGERLKFLADGPSLLAVFFPPAWLVWKRLWWALGVYLALVAVIFLLALTPLRAAVIFLSLIPGLYLWLEGNELVRQTYERRGWNFIGVVQGNDVTDAELRYHDLQRKNTSSAVLPDLSDDVPPTLRPSSQPEPQSIGLFPLEN